MASYWGDAFKYGLVTSVIVAPIVLLVDYYVIVYQALVLNHWLPKGKLLNVQ